jgi:tyrosyl-tRNA synthetase
MSKSLGNYIGVTEPPREIFGKAMSIPDDLLVTYFELALNADDATLNEVRSSLADGTTNPMVLKKRLAESLVDLYHPEGSGRHAREEFERVFSKKELPDEMPELTIRQLGEIGFDDPSKIYLVGLISKAEMAKSNSEARKLIESGAVTLDDEKITDPSYEFALDKEMVLKVGKRRFLRLKLG